MLRSRSVSFNDTDGNFTLFTTVGFCDVTIPADYDSGGSEPIIFVLTGGLLADGTAPDTFDGSLELGMFTVDGGSLLTATVSPDGFGLLPAARVVTFGLGGFSPEWDTLGLGQVTNPYGIGGFFPAGGNQRGAVLVDGASQGFPGTGFKHNVSDFAPWTGPIGWTPDCDKVGNEVAANTEYLQPGQVATLFLQMFVESTDEANPDRKLYGLVEGLTMSYNGTTVDIDVDAFKVGFAAGGSFTAVPSGTFGTPVFNPLRTVEAILPNLSDPNQDFYLTEVATARRPAGVSINYQRVRG